MSKKLLGKFGIFQVSHRSQLTHSRQHTCFPTQARPITWTSSDTVCASAAERNWSVYGQIKTASRGTMGHAVADKRVYCHEALHNRLKLQKADYKQGVEKWDTDSDTDASDDEADLAV